MPIYVSVKSNKLKTYITLVNISLSKFFTLTAVFFLLILLKIVIFFIIIILIY